MVVICARDFNPITVFHAIFLDNKSLGEKDRGGGWVWFGIAVSQATLRALAGIGNAIEAIFHARVNVNNGVVPPFWGV